MEKICQNIIENEFRFMTPINYFFSSSVGKKKSLFSTKTFIPLIFIHSSQKRRTLYVCTNENTSFFLHENLSNIYYFLLRNISFYIIVCACEIFFHHQFEIYLCYVYVAFISSFFFSFIIIFLVLIAFHISRMISCNVACNDGTFVGLLIRNQMYFLSFHSFEVLFFSLLFSSRGFIKTYTLTEELLPFNNSDFGIKIDWKNFRKQQI